MLIDELFLSFVIVIVGIYFQHSLTNKYSFFRSIIYNWRLEGHDPKEEIGQMRRDKNHSIAVLLFICYFLSNLYLLLISWCWYVYGTTITNIILLFRVAIWCSLILVPPIIYSVFLEMSNRWFGVYIYPHEGIGVLTGKLGWLIPIILLILMGIMFFSS